MGFEPDHSAGEGCVSVRGGQEVLQLRRPDRAPTFDTDSSLLHDLGAFQVLVNGPEELLAGIPRVPPSRTREETPLRIDLVASDPSEFGQSLLAQSGWRLIANADHSGMLDMWTRDGDILTRFTDATSLRRGGTASIVSLSAGGAARAFRSESQFLAIDAAIGAGSLVVHAGMVVGPSSTGVLFAGAKGSGKSTASVMANLLADWRCVTDDTVVVPEPFTHAVGLYKPPAARADLLSDYGVLVDTTGTRDEKDVLKVGAASSERIRIAAVVLPQEVLVAAPGFDRIDPATAVERLGRNLTRPGGTKTPTALAWLSQFELFEYRYRVDVTDPAPLIELLTHITSVAA